MACGEPRRGPGDEAQRRLRRVGTAHAISESVGTRSPDTSSVSSGCVRRNWRMPVITPSRPTQCLAAFERTHSGRHRREPGRGRESRADALLMGHPVAAATWPARGLGVRPQPRIAPVQPPRSEQGEWHVDWEKVVAEEAAADQAGAEEGERSTPQQQTVGTGGSARPGERCRDERGRTQQPRQQRTARPQHHVAARQRACVEQVVLQVPVGERLQPSAASEPRYRRSPGHRCPRRGGGCPPPCLCLRELQQQHGQKQHPDLVLHEGGDAESQAAEARSGALAARACPAQSRRLRRRPRCRRTGAPPATFMGCATPAIGLATLRHEHGPAPPSATRRLRRGATDYQWTGAARGPSAIAEPVIMDAQRALQDAQGDAGRSRRAVFGVPDLPGAEADPKCAPTQVQDAWPGARSPRAVTPQTVTVAAGPAAGEASIAGAESFQEPQQLGVGRQHDGRPGVERRLQRLHRLHELVEVGVLAIGAGVDRCRLGVGLALDLQGLAVRDTRWRPARRVPSGRGSRRRDPGPRGGCVRRCGAARRPSARTPSAARSRRG